MTAEEVGTTEQPADSDEVVIGCGERLRQAREAAGLSLEQAARRVHLSMRVLNALENEQWADIGAAVFVRGHLRSYAKILGLDAGELLEQAHLSQLKSPTLHGGIDTYSSSAELRPRIGRSLLIALALLVLAAPILWQVLQTPDDLPAPAALSPDISPTHTHTISTQASSRSPERPLIEFTHIAPIDLHDEETGSGDEQSAEISAEGEEPAEFEDESFETPESVVDLSSAFLSLSFTGESWVEIRAANGALVESGIIPAGQVRAFEPGQVSRIKLGNAAGVEVRHAGERIESSRLGRGNVVYFRVSLDGSVQPMAAQ